MFRSGSTMMRAGRPLDRAMQPTPTAAPTASRSAFLWPMMRTVEASDTSSPKAFAMTRERTFVRFSNSAPLPP